MRPKRLDGVMTLPSQPAVLIVEDEPLVRMVVADTLVSQNIEALEAEDAASALELLDAHPDVSVLFTDVDMPGMDGIELARRVLEMRPAIQLIVTSGKHRHRDEDLPDDGTFLAKPYEMNKLVDLVQRKLDAAAQQR